MNCVHFSPDFRAMRLGIGFFRLFSCCASCFDLCPHPNRLTRGLPNFTRYQNWNRRYQSPFFSWPHWAPSHYTRFPSSSSQHPPSNTQISHKLYPPTNSPPPSRSHSDLYSIPKHRQLCTFCSFCLSRSYMQLWMKWSCSWIICCSF